MEGEPPQEGGIAMDWDLGLQGLALLGALSLGFGTFVGLVMGKGMGGGLPVAPGRCGASEMSTSGRIQPDVHGLGRALY